MKILFALVAVLVVVSVIEAAPKPTNRKRASNKATVARKNDAQPVAKRQAHAAGKVQKRAEKNKRQIAFLVSGNAVDPNYYAQHSAPLIDFQSALHAAFLSGVHYAELEKYLKKQNLTDSSGKPSPLEAKTLAVFEALFGEKKDDSKGAADSKAKFIAFDGLNNVDIVNPFLLANNVDEKFLKADGGVPSAEAGKVGNANSSSSSSVVALVNPYRGSHVETVFGPEIAPRYEIHYSPGQGLTLDPLTPFAAAGINSAAVGVPPAVAPAAAYGTAAVASAYGPAAYAPEIAPFNGFAIAPNFNGLAAPYPYPYPFLPGFDPKALKPNGKGSDEKKLDSTDQPTESTSQSYPEASSETPAEAAPSESPSEPPSESPASEAPQ